MQNFFIFPKNFSILIVFYLIIGLSTQYFQLNINDDDLCSKIKRRKIRLGKDSNSSLIVFQTRLNDHKLDWLHDDTCKFHIISNYDGVFAVIETLKFRKDYNTNECIDYVQFIKKNGIRSRQFCGEIDAATIMDNFYKSPIGIISENNSFIDERGELDVIIFVAKESLKKDEKMNLSIIFTSYKTCGYLKGPYLPCGSRGIERNFCIHYDFFYDSHINCPFLDCVDVRGCIKQININDDSVTPEPSIIEHKVLIGTLSTLFVIFLFFIMCIYTFRYFKLLCWAENFANPSSSNLPEIRENSSHIELNENRLASTVPTVPPSVENDKDLPPSYDSLFPQRVPKILK